jgi:AraC-like DNA-binding protein
MSISRHTPDACIKIRSFGVTFSPGQVVLPRPEQWHQLVYATRGVMTVRTDECAWVVPPHRAVWIPAKMRCRVEMTGVVAMRTIYVRTKSRGISRACSVVNVTPLLRELIVRTVRLSVLDLRIPEQRRLIGVILDELRGLQSVPLQLPVPQDPRAARFAALAGRHLGCTRSPESTEKMLRECGASRRTMERLFQRETGISLGQWLRRQKVLDGLRRLAAGGTVNNVALELGYNGASAFIAMFRRELGQTPARYVERR